MRGSNIGRSQIRSYILAEALLIAAVNDFPIFKLQRTQASVSTRLKRAQVIRSHSGSSLRKRFLLKRAQAVKLAILLKRAQGLRN